MTVTGHHGTCRISVILASDLAEGYSVAMILPIRVKRRVLSLAFRSPTARENENLSALPHVEALHERRLRVL
jgi:hypothetical protein